mmetsp:Transcript_4729/g.6888  ORF Transcript_4729/g.6888 Transcript_4729/m.6888 type:complete len:218 (-) Transcript_4729:109-762(-)
MGIKVVRNIRTLASPCLECVQLVLRLRHVCIHVLKITQVTSSITCVRIKWVQPLVHLNRYENAFLPGLVGKFDMMLKLLHDGLRYHYMHTLFDALHRNVKMRIIGGEYNRYITRFECIRSSHIGLGVNLVVTWKGFAREVHTIINIANTALHMGPNTRKLLPVNTAHSKPVHFVSASHIEHSECYYSSTLVTVSCCSSHITCSVLACTYHQYVHFLA